MRLDGRAAPVTGGGRGVGPAAALACAGAGAAVAVVARSRDELDETVRLVEAGGGRAAAWVADVTDRAAVEAAVAAAADRFGPIDLLVSGAGANGPFGPLWELDPAEWWRRAAVNLLGPLLCARAVLPGIVARGRGVIVNVASGAGLRGAKYNSSYTTAKAALIRLSECLASKRRSTASASTRSTPGWSGPG